MVPGQHHVRMHMYIAQAQGGTFKIVKDLGVIDRRSACRAPDSESAAHTSARERLP